MYPQSLDQASGAPAPLAYNPYVDPAGLGVRTIGCDTFSGELLEVLRLTPDLGPLADVEPLVRERMTVFDPAQLQGLSSVMRVERTFDGRLEVWSRLAPGYRLSAVLEWTEARQTAPSINAVLTVGDRLFAALGSLQALDQTEGASGHGAIAIDQIVISDTGDLTLTDYAFGTAIAALQWPREKLWRRFRIAVPPAAGLARFDHRVDVTQAAVVIVSLLAGRVFREEEYPRKLDALIVEALNHSCAGIERDERNRLSAWLRAATELDPRSTFNSAAQARQALRAALGHRLDDGVAVAAWLRAARGLPEIDPAPVAPAPVLAPVPEPVVAALTAPEPVAAPPADRAGKGGKLFRKWLSRS